MARTTTNTQQRPPVQPIQEMPAAPVDNLPAPRPRTAVAPIVPANWQEITAIAGAICRAKMAPKSYCDQQGNPFPDKVAIAIMHGMEVGMTPMASLQSLAVINGMPSLYGDGMLAVVRASGMLEDIVEEMEWDNHGPVKATCKVKRKGEPTWGVMECARADAQKAGWWGKTGPWSLTPHRMMQMRSRGWALRDKFADVLRGLHSAEEMEDLVDVTPRGSATINEPAPPEPKRDDPKYQQPSADGKQTSQPDQQERGQPEGQADNKAPAPSGAPASKQATDVEDLNEKAAEPITFEDFKTARAFFEFSHTFLTDETRPHAQIVAWEEYYRTKLHECQQHEYQRIRDATQETLELYHAALKRSAPREPGQEG